MRRQESTTSPALSTPAPLININADFAPAPSAAPDRPYPGGPEDASQAIAAASAAVPAPIQAPIQALRTNGGRRPRTGPDWAGVDLQGTADRAAADGAVPSKVYRACLRSFMRIERKDGAAAAVRLLPERYRPVAPSAAPAPAPALPDNGSVHVRGAAAPKRDAAPAPAPERLGPAEVLEAFNAYMGGVVFKRLERQAAPGLWTFPAAGSDTLADWQRRAGVVVGRDGERLSAKGRRGAARSADVRQSARRPRNAAIWRWARDGRGLIVIVENLKRHYPDFAVGLRRVQQILAVCRAAADRRRRTKAGRAAAERKRARARRDAIIVQRLEAGGMVRWVARHMDVSPATVRRAAAAVGLRLFRSAQAEYRALLGAINRRNRPAAARPAARCLWMFCAGETYPRVAGLSRS